MSLRDCAVESDENHHHFLNNLVEEEAVLHRRVSFRKRLKQVAYYFLEMLQVIIGILGTISSYLYHTNNGTSVYITNGFISASTLLILLVSKVHKSNN